MRFLPPLVAVAVLVASVPASLLAQADATAIIRGTARSTFNGRPLVGVMISVPAARAFAVSDSSGRFELRGIPAGNQRVRISYLGRDTEEYTFDLEPRRAKRLDVLLDVEALDLAPVVVEATHPDFSRNLAGFFNRKKWYSGFARFFTREDLERAHTARLVSVLARDGILVRCTIGGCIPTRFSRGALCAVAVSVDGMPFWEQDYDEIAINEVQGVEIYRSGYWSMYDLPVVANTMGANPRLPTCGSVLIWTR